MNGSDLLRDFIALWVVIDPISTMSIFLAATAGATDATRRAIIFRTIPISAAILIFFILFGQMLLDVMGISLVSFQIAGGIVLFLFSLSMIFADGDREARDESAPLDVMQTAIFPMAMPGIAGPGTMLTVMLLTDNRTFSAGEQVGTALMLMAVLLVTMLVLLLAGPIHNLIGKPGESIISRVMGMVLAAFSVDTVLNGLAEVGVVPGAV